MFIKPLPTPVPSRADPANFRERADETLGALPLFINQANQLAIDVEDLKDQAALSALDAANQVVLAQEQVVLSSEQAAIARTAKDIAVGAANYQGEYSHVILYLIGQSVTYLGERFIKKSNAAAGTVPVDGLDWFLIPAGGITYDIINTSENLQPNFGYLVDTSISAFSVTLPESPVKSDLIRFSDLAGYFGINALTINRNGQKIMGLEENLTADTPYVSFGLVYSNSTYGWVFA